LATLVGAFRTTETGTINDKFSPIVNSSRAYALRANWSRPNSLLCYLLFALGLATAASPNTKAWLRVLGAGTAFLSVAFFSFHRWQLSKAFLRHSVSANTADFADIGKHYGVVTRPDGTSFFPGNNGFWVAELLVTGRPTGEIVGCIGLGEFQEYSLPEMLNNVNPDCAFRADPSHPELRRMAVSSSLQRKGIGRRLLEELLRHARDRKLRAINIQTTAHSKSAVGIYERFGWRIISEQGAPGKPWLDFRLVELTMEL
jgi:ribosomal protein S18 acetylase RimI-like enzyme